MKNVALIALSSLGLYGQWITGYYIAENPAQPFSAIPWSKYTHIIHSTLNLNADGSVSSYVTLDLGNGIVAAAHNAGKKILIGLSIGSSYPQATAPAVIATSVANITSFVNTNGYDGVDLDWENSPIILSQYEDLISRLRTAMPTKVITMAIGDWYSLPAVAANQQAHLDQINVMCYDADGGEHSGVFTSWYNNPLHGTCDVRVANVISAGVAANKIGGGAPFYGRRSFGCTAINQTCSSSSTIYYRDLVTDPARWQSQYQFYDNIYKSNYLSISSLNEFDSYNGVQFISDLVTWGRSLGFGGYFAAYDIGFEYLSSQTGDARYPLSTALYNAVFGATPPLSPATMTVTPGSLSFSQSAGGPAPSAQAVSVSSSGSALNFSAIVSTNSGGGWLSVGPSAGTAPGVLSVSVNGAGLPAGTYSGWITIVSAAAANSPLSIPVGLTVPAPPTLYYYSEDLSNPNWSNWITNGNITSQWYAKGAYGGVGGGSGWMLNKTFNSGGEVKMTLRIPGGGSGTFLAYLCANILYDSLVSYYSIGITTSSFGSSLTVSKQTLAGLSLLASTSVGVHDNMTVRAVVQPDGQILAYVDNTLVLSVKDTSPIGMGRQGLGVWGTSPGYLISRVDLSTPPLPPPGPYETKLAVNPGSLSFSQIAGGPGASAQTVSVSSSGGALNFSANASTNNGGNWLWVSPSSGTTAGMLSVSVNSVGLPPGTYTGSITIVSTAAANSPLAIPVSLTVTALPSLYYDSEDLSNPNWSNWITNGDITSQWYTKGSYGGVGGGSGWMLHNTFNSGGEVKITLRVPGGGSGDFIAYLCANILYDSLVSYYAIGVSTSSFGSSLTVSKQTVAGFYRLASASVGVHDNMTVRAVVQPDGQILAYVDNTLVLSVKDTSPIGSGRQGLGVWGTSPGYLISRVDLAR